MLSSLRRLSFSYSGIVILQKELYIIALMILLWNTFSCFKVVMTTISRAPTANCRWILNKSEIKSIYHNYYLQDETVDSKMSTCHTSQQSINTLEVTTPQEVVSQCSLYILPRFWNVGVVRTFCETAWFQPSFYWFLLTGCNVGMCLQRSCSNTVTDFSRFIGCFAIWPILSLFQVVYAHCWVVGPAFPVSSVSFEPWRNTF